MAAGATDRSGRRPHAAAVAVVVLVLMQHANASAQEPPPSPPPSAPSPEVSPSPSPGAAPSPDVAPITPVVPAAYVPPSPALEPEPPPDGTNPNRTVRGHQFIFPQFVDSAFVATYFGLRMRLGAFEAPALPTQFGPTNLNAINFSQGFDLGVRIVDALGLFVSAGGRSLVSSNFRSLVYQGATFDYGANGGLVLRVLRSERTGTQLAVRGQAGFSRGQLASLFPLFAAANARVALEDVVQGNLGEAIRTPFSSVHFAGSVAIAQAISRVVGLQASGGLGYSSVSIERWDVNTSTRPKTSFNGLTYRAGVAASVDLAPLDVPIAIMGEYLLSREPTSSQLSGGDEFDIVTTVFGGVYYSARPNLQLGLGGGAELGLGPSRSTTGRSERPRVILGQFVLRYVW